MLVTYRDGQTLCIFYNRSLKHVRDSKQCGTSLTAKISHRTHSHATTGDQGLATLVASPNSASDCLHLRCNEVRFFPQPTQRVLVTVFSGVMRTCCYRRVLLTNQTRRNSARNLLINFRLNPSFSEGTSPEPTPNFMIAEMLEADWASATECS